MPPSNLKQLFLRWYETGNPEGERQAAATAAVRRLLPHLRLPPQLRRVDGIQSEDLVQEVLRELFDPVRRHLENVPDEKIIPYARRALQRRALSVLRTAIGRREADEREAGRAPQADHGGLRLDEPAHEVEVLHDLSRVFRRLDMLEWQDRMAVLLTTCPNRISEEDWLRLVPAGGRRPAEGLSLEEASKLIKPPAAAEDAEGRSRRKDWLRQRLNRALGTLLSLADEEGGA